MAKRWQIESASKAPGAPRLHSGEDDAILAHLRSNENLTSIVHVHQLLDPQDNVVSKNVSLLVTNERLAAINYKGMLSVKFEFIDFPFDDLTGRTQIRTGGNQLEFFLFDWEKTDGHIWSAIVLDRKPADLLNSVVSVAIQSYKDID